MEFEQILQLIDHVSASRLEGFCYESEDLKLTLNNKLAPVILPEMTGQTSQNMMQKVPQIISNSTMPADEIEQLSSCWNLLCCPFRGCSGICKSRR